MPSDALSFATLDPAALDADSWVVETASAGETHALGRAFASRLTPGDVVALYGTLGAGKTAFTTGLCEGLGTPASRVSSPTFTLVQEYPADEGMVYHIDAYRIENVNEFFELGFEEYFYGDGYCVVEWPGRVEALLPAHTLRLRFTHLGEDRRRIERLPL